MGDTKFYKNLALFFLTGAVWIILDLIFGNTTDLTDLLIVSFFIVWNTNQCKKDKAI